jgi:hypothetical protein
MVLPSMFGSPTYDCDCSEHVYEKQQSSIVRESKEQLTYLRDEPLPQLVRTFEAHFGQNGLGCAKKTKKVIHRK